MERVNRDNFQTYLNTLCIRKENTYAKFTDDKEGKVIPQGVIFEQLRSEITNKISNAVLQSAEQVSIEPTKDYPSDMVFFGGSPQDDED